MSMPSFEFLVSLRSQRTWPVAGSRAKADLSVAPKSSP
jgi:hypothetical protein